MTPSRPPLVLSDEVTVTLSSTATVAGTVPFQLDGLTNSYRVPMEVREIHWTVGGAGTPGAFIAAQLASGQDSITRDFTHVCMMGRSYGASAGGELEGSTSGAGGGPGHYRWVFPRPMLLLPGQGLRAAVRYDVPAALVGAQAATAAVAIALVGRYFTDAIPAARCVPYVSEFVASNAPGRLKSLPEEFYNPFNSPLQVQRFLARAMARGLAGVGDVFDVTLGARPGTIAMDTPGGYEAFPGVLPLTDVFEPQSRMWQAPHVVEGRNAWHSISVASLGSGQAQPAAIYFSMVGHREEGL